MKARAGSVAVEVVKVDVISQGISLGNGGNGIKELFYTMKLTSCRR